MDQHVTYHPVDVQLARLFACFTLDERGADLATEYCKRQNLAPVHAARLLDLLPHYAGRTDSTFDQTHGFHVAVAHGFFDSYYYINAGSLSSLGDLLEPYVEPWQQILPGDSRVATATNSLSGPHSSGVFIGPDKVAQFMADAHAVPALTEALATSFPGVKAHVLWAALQRALDAGSGLLEATGVVAPNTSDLQTSESYTKFTNCDEDSLHAFVEAHPPSPSAVPDSSTQPPPPTGSPTPEDTSPPPPAAHTDSDETSGPSVPAHLADTSTTMGTRGGAAGLAERLRAKRLEPETETEIEIEIEIDEAVSEADEPLAPEAESGVDSESSPALAMVPELVEQDAPELALAAEPDLEPIDEPESPIEPQLDSGPSIAGGEGIDDSPEPVDTRLRLSAGGSLDDGATFFDCWDELWTSISPLGAEEPIFLEVSDMGGRWEPFSLIGTQAGTAVVRYRGAEDASSLRVFGAHVDDLGQLDAATRNAVVVDWTGTESERTTGSFAIPRTHLLAPHQARLSGQTLIGECARQPIFNDLEPVAAR